MDVIQDRGEVSVPGRGRSVKLYQDSSRYLQILVQLGRGIDEDIVPPLNRPAVAGPVDVSREIVLPRFDVSVRGYGISRVVGKCIYRLVARFAVAELAVAEPAVCLT